ncbi:MAG: M23 family metallopeptidase, partial [Proteobacteria bacterium]|nr:M23 family metallopeptidase [Pseudomonadota bacterium]
DAAAENKTKFSCQFGLCITQAGQDKIDAVAAQAQKERAAKALQEQQNQPKIQNAALTRQETSAQQTLSDPKRFVPTGIPVDNGEVRDQLGACRGGGCIRPHMGTDVGGAREAPVKATAAGVVIRSDCNDSGGYGCQTLIDHGNGYKTRYSHLTTNLPRVGSFVEKGQIISGIGYDTRSPHVHYEVLVDDSKVDIARQGITGIRQGSGKIGVAGMVAINPIQAESGLMAVARPSRFESAPVNTDLAGTLATAAVGTGGGRQYPAGRMSLGMGGGGTNYGGNYAGQNFGPYGNGSGNANNGGLMGLLSGFFGGGQPQDGQQGGIPGSTVGYPPTNPSPTNPSTDLTAAVTPLTNNSITPIKTAAVDCSKAVLGIDRILACGQAKPPTTVQTTTCGNNATAAASGLSTSGCAVVR